jgi:3-oxoacyl-[acyl-carrier-protein] synthase III
MFIPHQANIRIMESARERLGIEINISISSDCRPALSTTRVDASPIILTANLKTSRGKYLYLNKDTGKLVMNGREVFKFAVRIMGEASTFSTVTIRSHFITNDTSSF